MGQPLPDRLDAVLQLLTPCQLLADVATDHGLLAVAAVEQGVAQRALACDLRAAPLQAARVTIEKRELQDVVTTQRGDGLKPLSGRNADAVVIAGLSGELIVRMLVEGAAVLNTVTQVVLQANIGVEVVRRWARDHGWHLRAERAVAQRDRTYVVLALVKGEGPDPAYVHERLDVDTLGWLGPLLLKKRDAAARADWLRQVTRLEPVAKKGGAEQQQALSWFNAGLSEFERPV